jgi:hypothetical protein
MGFEEGTKKHTSCVKKPENYKKGQKDQKVWVHTYLTVSSRPGGSCVQSLVQIGSEM